MRAEWGACAIDPLYFIDRYCRVYDAEAQDWIPFRLWDSQEEALPLFETSRRLIILKARQLGFTWLALAYVLWRMTFCPRATCLLFSKREKEAIYLLGRERLRGMHARLPHWLRVPAMGQDAATVWSLANGSVAHAFPSNAGDSYTATVALVDEADLVPDLDDLLGRVKPTVDAGGQLILLSRPDKSQPESAFKKVYRAARARRSDWVPLFFPWRAHPARSAEWYEAQRRDVLARTGSLDDLHEQYPATEAEALSPRTLDKRIPSAWLEAVTRGCAPLPNLPRGSPAVPGLEVYRLPSPGRRYCVGADPAEGNPTSDDSAAVFLDVETGEEVAALAGKFQPDPFADYVSQVARWFNRAPVLVERNNHGHAVLSRLRANGTRRLLHRDGREGWLTTQKSKAELWDLCAESVREGEVIIRSLATFSQLASIDGNTLSAPEGQHDDRAVAFALASAARPKAGGGRVEAPAEDSRNAADRMPGGVWG